MHDDVIKWKHFPHYWPFVRGIHRSPVYSPHKGQWCGAFMFPLTCDCINSWVNNREAGDLRRYCAHYDVMDLNIATETKWPPFRRRHFNVHFFNENAWIFIKMSMKFLPMCSINNIPTLVQIMAWRRQGDKPLSETITVSLLTHIYVSVS